VSVSPRRRRSTPGRFWLSLLPLLLAGTEAMELTPKNWEEATAGKSVFIKFQAPW